MTYSDLNAEFNNVLNNANSLISPFTANVAAGGYKITGLGAATANGDALPWLTGSFTGTLTGCTTTPTVTISYSIANNVATLSIASGLQGTSNATTMTITGAPAAVFPVSGVIGLPVAAADNSSNLVTPARADISSGGVITLYKDFAGTAWTGSNVKGLQAGKTTLAYSLT